MCEVGGVGDVLGSAAGDVAERDLLRDASAEVGRDNVEHLQTAAGIPVLVFHHHGQAAL